MKLFIPMKHIPYEDTVPVEEEPHAYLTYEAAMKIAKSQCGYYADPEVLEVEFDGR